MPPPLWRVAVGELRLGPFLAVSFQRYPLLPPPGTGPLPAAPGSWGALQPGTAGREDEVLLPVPDGEAFWVGLRPRRARLRLRVVLAVETPRGLLLDPLSGDPLDRPGSPASLDVVDTAACDGIRSSPAGGVWPFTREPATPEAPATLALTLTAVPAARLLPAARPSRPRPLHGVGGLVSRREPGPATPPPEGGWREDRAASARVRLVAPAEFARLTGEETPPPLDPRARYGGWRLP